MRLIDKDTVLFALNDNWLAITPNETDNEEVKLERAAIARGVELAFNIVRDIKESGWISVKDKYRPLIQTCVLVVLENGQERRVRCSYYDKYKGVEIWSDKPAGFEITHWMPLPEPPKEEEDD